MNIKYWEEYGDPGLKTRSYFFNRIDIVSAKVQNYLQIFYDMPTNNLIQNLRLIEACKIKEINIKGGWFKNEDDTQAALECMGTREKILLLATIADTMQKDIYYLIIAL